MARGKNYVNNNRGVALQKSHGGRSSKSQDMQPCKYGAGCQRKDCIYRHPAPAPASSSSASSAAAATTGGGGVCMAYLAGTCTFGRKGCNKRHPSTQEECNKLRARYKAMNCRFGNDCHTEGCLYKHPNDENDGGGDGVAFIGPSNFPPLSSSGAGSATTNDGGGSPRPQTSSSVSAWSSAPVGVFKHATGAFTVARNPQDYQKRQELQQQMQQQQLPRQHGGFVDVVPTSNHSNGAGGASAAGAPGEGQGYHPYPYQQHQPPVQLYSNNFGGSSGGYYPPHLRPNKMTMAAAPAPPQNYQHMEMGMGTGNGSLGPSTTTFNTEAKEFIPSSTMASSGGTTEQKINE
mmetsp:Transcript_11068/g.26312  ORF Transcript_11068/g.26312 Transcript_11068/m.26312 type:complete len:347 (+) Transcript_11068:156-1196(+)